jgi:hypothetical protein
VQQARRPLARARRRPTRVVRPGAQRVTFTLDDPERTALRVGLSFAAHLQRLFPQVYQEHIRARKTTMASLLGVVGTFLSLAHTELIALDMEAYQITPGGFGGWYTSRLPFAPKNPVSALIPQHGNETARWLLANEGKAWLQQPVPKVYGVGVDAVVAGDNRHRWGRTIGKHALTLAIWQMFSATPWAPLLPERISELALERCTDVQQGQAIAVLPVVPADTPLAPLCAWLDREKPRGLRQLGALIAYACQRTGIGFADTPPEEVRHHYEMVVDLDWERPAAAFADARNEQEVAASFANAYSRLAGRFQREPDLLVAIRAAILEGVAATSGDDRSFAIYNPHALIWRTQ